MRADNLRGIRRNGRTTLKVYCCFAPRVITVIIIVNNNTTTGVSTQKWCTGVYFLTSAHSAAAVYCCLMSRFSQYYTTIKYNFYTVPLHEKGVNHDGSRLAHRFDTSLAHINTFPPHGRLNKHLHFYQNSIHPISKFEALF